MIVHLSIDLPIHDQASIGASIHPPLTEQSLPHALELAFTEDGGLTRLIVRVAKDGTPMYWRVVKEAFYSILYIFVIPVETKLIVIIINHLIIIIIIIDIIIIVIIIVIVVIVITTLI